MSKITTDECERLVTDFLNKHITDYTEREIKYIKRNATSIMQSTPNIYVADILRQIYDELGLLPDAGNMYHGFANLLENNFDLNGHIIEVGGGVIPSLAKKIALRQQSGTITVYDPRVIPQMTNSPNLILKRQAFTKNTLIPNANIIIGFMPCDATIPIIEAAALNNIDFMIGLCEGGARTGYEWLESEDEWLSFITYTARHNLKKRDDKTLGILSLESYGDPYPIIYSKKK